MTIVCWGKYKETIKHPAVDRQSSSNSYRFTAVFQEMITGVTERFPSEAEMRWS